MYFLKAEGERMKEKWVKGRGRWERDRGRRRRKRSMERGRRRREGKGEKLYGQLCFIPLVTLEIIQLWNQAPT